MSLNNSKHPMCPDCGGPLIRKGAGTNKKLSCDNSECPVIRVTFERGDHHGRIIRVTRAALGRMQQQ